ncbi:uncharacterized protein LOC133708013 isoform X2 [Rosa rugosa]|uniref:uncharacterized protein LOC133708013 isoform X2 n=1 Tax=Rosa rugosa TaxID=74645 RepID=UPI002B40F3AE|nr:uncharacterized protein LOC133708013 isoform X2 [Rosa rugosa]
MGSSYWGKDRRKMGFNLDIEIPKLKLGFHLWVLRFGDLGVSRRFLFALFAENLQQTIFSNHSKASASLLSTIGNRVRLATHANFKDFVLTVGLEFFPLGGDPKFLPNAYQ